jgi:hypothetical protein
MEVGMVVLLGRRVEMWSMATTRKGIDRWNVEEIMIGVDRYQVSVLPWGREVVMQRGRILRS